MSNCVYCTAQTSCSSCAKYYILYNYYDNSGKINATCTCPNPTCLTCNNSDKDCASCDTTTRNLTSNQCMPLPGFYENNLAAAAPCQSNCTTCTNITNCTTCYPNFYMSSESDNVCLSCSDLFLECANCTIDTTTNFA